MEDKALYTQILGIQSPWEVMDIELDIDQERIDISVEWPAGMQAHCPVCQKENKETLCKIHDRRKERVWRHRDTCQMKTFIHSHIPRVKCPEHGIKTITIDWADEMARFSHLFEGFAIQMLKMSSGRMFNPYVWISGKPIFPEPAVMYRKPISFMIAFM